MRAIWILLARIPPCARRRYSSSMSVVTLKSMPEASIASRGPNTTSDRRAGSSASAGAT
jgi:hypothetical protein